MKYDPSKFNPQQQVDVPTMLSHIAGVLGQDQQQLNQLDQGPGGGTHGQRVAEAFRRAADAASQAGTNDAGAQLEAAAQEMRQSGLGKSTGYYADGLEQAAQQVQGQSGISLQSLLPFLQSFLGGVQRNNPAQPGQGTMIDALLPAVQSLMGANTQGGGGMGQALIGALGSAVNGARGTASMPGGGMGRVDPGAASATGVLGGIVSSILPGVLGSLTGGGGSAQGGYPQQQAPSSGIGGLGGILGALGGIMGGNGGQTQQQGGGSQSGGWPFGSV